MTPESKHSISFKERQKLYKPYQKIGHGYKRTHICLTERGIIIPLDTVKSDWRKMKQALEEH